MACSGKAMKKLLPNMAAEAADQPHAPPAIRLKTFNPTPTPTSIDWKPPPPHQITWHAVKKALERASPHYLVSLGPARLAFLKFFFFPQAYK